MALHYIHLSANPDLRPYLQRASEERAAVVYAAWKGASRAIAAPFRRLVEAVRRARRASRTAATLRGLSDRQLEDIGLTRGEISGVAEAVADAPEAHVTLSDLRRGEAARRDTRRGRLVPWAARSRSPRQPARAQSAA